MKRGSATDFLIRTVLDEAFRELATTDPQRAFDDYDLSEEERDILCSRDNRLLRLLGGSGEQGEAPSEHPAEPETSPTVATPRASLPEVKLLLRLAPHVTQSPDSAAEVAYEASLHPWTGEHQPRRSNAVGEDGDRSPEIEWVVHIRPTVIESLDAGVKVAYSASIHPLAADTNPTQSSPRLPWDHHVESSAAMAAARAVRDCDADQRYEKLLRLVQALQTGDDLG